MIGAVRQTFRSSRGRLYQGVVGTHLLESSNTSTQRLQIVTHLSPVPVDAFQERLQGARLPSFRFFSAGAAEAVKDSAPAAAPKVKLFVGGKLVESQATDCIDVINPATQDVVSRVPLTTNEEFESAVSVAKDAFKTWRNTPVTTRQRVMLKLQELIRRDMDKLALSVTSEQGKTLVDARGDVFRGLEVSNAQRKKF